MNNLSTIGKRIKFCRINCQLTQAQLGDKLGYSQPRVAQWEHDDRITLDIIEKIAVITGFPKSFLLGTDND